MHNPIICFGQQPCGFFPKRFLYAKIVSARELQNRIGGEIVFFYHDSDHDARETQTVLAERHSGEDRMLNFQFANKIQKRFSPLYAKQIAANWHATMARQLPNYVSCDLVRCFRAASADNPADFCLQIYQHMGLLSGIRVQRSSDPKFRHAACPVEDFFVDVQWRGETVRARRRYGKLMLHEGGDKFIELPPQEFGPEQISPTRDTRFRWMQSVIGCTHYVAGAGERQYLNEGDAAGVELVPRMNIPDSSKAYVGE